MNVTPSQFDLLQQLLGASNLRHRVISQNIANVNVPGYRRQEVTFEEELARQMSGVPNTGLSATARIVATEGLPERADGNNVDIDREMGELNKNALLMQAYTQILAGKMAMMRSAITGQ